MQSYDIDYRAHTHQKKTPFVLVAKFNMVRVFLSLATNQDWPLLQFDIEKYFLHGIHNNPPLGIPEYLDMAMVCKLK